MIRKTKRKPPKEATTIKHYVIPECNRILTENNQSVFRMRKAIIKLFQVDSFVPAWPWEMKYGYSRSIRHHVQKMFTA